MLNGTLIDLQAGAYSAQVATCGATLVSLQKAGRDLIVPFAAQTSLGAGWQGKTLLPWPNRVRSSRYTYAGSTFALPCNEPETGAALHGLVGWSDFQIATPPLSPGGEVSSAPALAPRELTLQLTMPASYAYPWALSIDVHFSLSAARGLKVCVTTKNLGAAAPTPGAPGAPRQGESWAPAPYGVSCHPYLTRSMPLEKCTLQVPATRVLDVDPRTLCPTVTRDVAGSNWDWRRGRALGNTTSDNAYTGLPASWQARLSDPDGSAVVLSAQSPWVQIYTADQLGRCGVAVEPMTCPPDAFNSGIDLLTLPVGSAHTFTFNIHEESN